ncbi:DUF456 domain-containing protein [Psychroflexus halocasei]|uniref:DNA phosphorothioation-dependent restriction protein DptG n=1 Tax=Psychroflexus halocasei TaxID=908615 RepID=A0A1H4DWI4_9FLAO|nr:DUF456 domain-containing protein [Psychroflexus halocasei]SEA76740.1 DNA phosphorothioation-dependent restriction protein DptG [Psychroflexus halocasei]
MKINDIINYLTEFRKNTKSIKNQKYSEKFIRLLNEIEIKVVDPNQIQRIETELKLLVENFEIEKENIQVKKELKKFIQFLKSEFKITIPYYYTQLGALVGLIATIFFGFLSLFIGLIAGAAIGFFFDERAKKEGRKLNTELNEFLC